MPEITDRAGWVLAGGASRRMGFNKALLEIEGRPMLLRAADALAKACGVVSVVGSAELYGSFGVPVVEDRFHGLGPLAGIEAALAATSARWNLIVACDMPALDARVLGSLFGGRAQCSLPVLPGGSAEPLCAVFDRSCHGAIAAAIEAGTRRVIEAISRLPAVRYVAIPDPTGFANLNTPDDLRRYQNA